MKTRFFLYAFSIGKYILTGSDVTDFYHKFYNKVDLPIIISLGVFAFSLEILASSPNVAKSISMEYRRKIQLGIHIGLAVNSLAWMIYDEKSIFNITLFLVAIGVNFIFVHRILNVIQKENEELKNISRK